MNKIISCILIVSIFLAPLTVLAQTAACSPVNRGNYEQCCYNTQDGGAQACGAYIENSGTTGTSDPRYNSCANLTGSALTNCINAISAKSSLQKFNPNANLSGGNSYNGVSISGVGGAIASCANVGSMLVNAASSLFAKTGITKSIKSAFGFKDSSSDAVKTADADAKKQLETMNRTSQCLDGVAYAVAKNTLAQITTKTLNWVNTGLNGNPLYVQNVNSYLGSVATQATVAYLGGAQNSDPIFGNALRSSITFQITGKSDGKLNVPLDTPQAKNYNAFLSDFSNGGWNSLLNPSNNPIGALFNATDKIGTTITKNQLSASNEIQRNSGFLDMKRCVKYATNGNVALGTNQAGLTATLNQGTCVQWVTDTPGSIIANTVNFITSSPTRQLEYANKINEVLGNFFDSFVNNLLSKGLRGSGSNGKLVDFGLSSEGNNVVTDLNGGTLDINSSSTAALGYQSASSSGISTGDFDISRPQQLRSIVQTQYNFLNSTKDAQIALERIIPAIGALDYCIPGPNPDWQTNLDSNWQTFLGSIQQADPKDQTGVEKVLSIVPVVGGLLSGLVGLFTGSGDLPALWTMNSVLTDKVTGSGIQLNRTFYAPSGHSDNLKTPDVTNGLNAAYEILLNGNQYGYFNTSGNTFIGHPVGTAFENAASGDANSSYVDGFLQDAYTDTASLIGYNQAESTIDQQYDQNISDAQNNIRQLDLIRQQVNAIVATAKSRYIQERKDAGDPVNMACINQAYQIDNSSISGLARQEPNSANPLKAEEDAMVQHAHDSGNYFYSNEIN